MPWHSSFVALQLAPGCAHSVDPVDRLMSIGLFQRFAHARLVVEASIDSTVACHAH